MRKNKYNIGDTVKANIKFKNDARENVDAVILGAMIVEETNDIRYKIRFAPEDKDVKMGCESCTGFIMEQDILGLC